MKTKISLLFLSLVAITCSLAQADEAPKAPSKRSVSTQKVAPVERSVPLERAQGEKLATATGHYARSRALLISAVREFDKGLDKVDPSALVDAQVWRRSVLERIDELTRLLDPQPRATKTGIKYGNETVGIGDASKR